MLSSNRLVSIINQVWGQDGWIFLGLFMDRDGVEVRKLAKKERSQYPAILTEQAWLIRDLLKAFEEMFLSGYSG